MSPDMFIYKSREKCSYENKKLNLINILNLY